MFFFCVLVYLCYVCYSKTQRVSILCEFLGNSVCLYDVCSTKVKCVHALCAFLREFVFVLCVFLKSTVCNCSNLCS